MPTRSSSDIAFSRASAFDFLRTFIGTSDGVELTSFTSDPVVSMGADLTQGTLSLPGTRESTQIAPPTRPYDRAVTSMVAREVNGTTPVRQPGRTYQVRTYGCQMNV